MYKRKNYSNCCLKTHPGYFVASIGIGSSYETIKEYI